MSTYSFDITTNTITYNSTFSDNSFDLSEFDNDSRGTPRVADWSDIASSITTQSGFDTFMDTLDLEIDNTGTTTNCLWVGASAIDTDDLNGFNSNVSPNPPNRYYYVSTSGNRAFFIVPRTDTSGHASTDTFNDNKKISIFSAYASQNKTFRSLVYFPDNSSGSGSVAGDPHVVTFGGIKYTL